MCQPDFLHLCLSALLTPFVDRTYRAPGQSSFNGFLTTGEERSNIYSSLIKKHSICQDNITTNIATALLSTTTGHERSNIYRAASTSMSQSGYVTFSGYWLSMLCCSKSTYSTNFERNPVNHQLYMRPSIRLGTEAKEKVYSMKVWRYP